LQLFEEAVPRTVLNTAKPEIQKLLKTLPEKKWFLSQEKYEQIELYNKLLKLTGTREEKVEHFGCLYLSAGFAAKSDANGGPFVILYEHLQKSCSPELENARQQIASNEVKSNFLIELHAHFEKIFSPQLGNAPSEILPEEIKETNQSSGMALI
jgi:hypothetical protein